jgi:hypothetical protein
MAPFPVQELKDIHPAPPPGLSLLAWIAIAVLLAMVPIAIWMGMQWKRNAPFRKAGKELSNIAAGASAELFGSELNRWLKQTALLIWPREEIAALHGKQWLEFLSQHGNTDFLSFAANWESWVYGVHPIPDETKKLLIEHARIWLKNLPRNTTC